MKNFGLFSSIVFIAFTGMFPITSCQKEDSGFHNPNFLYSISIYGLVTDSNETSLVNAVVWMKQTYGSDIMFHTVSNDLGKFVIQLDIYNENFPRDFTIYVSKSGYKIQSQNIFLDSVDLFPTFILPPDLQDTVHPFCLGWESQSNYQTGVLEVIFYFSEEVIFDLVHINELACIIFQRRYDVCNYSSTTSIFENQDDIYSIGSNSIKFVHRNADSESCYSDYTHTYYTTYANWSFYSAHFLPYLCKDPFGNYLIEYTWIGK